jgi:hypothetical protein
MTHIPRPKSSWHLPKISLRVLMVVVLLIGAGFGWAVHIARAAGFQRESVLTIRKSGGDAFYACDMGPNGFARSRRPAYLTWLARRFGIDYFSSVVKIVLPFDPSDADLALAEHFPSIEELYLDGSRSAVTDVGIAHLNGLARLRVLGLSESAITDTGLAHLKGMKSLQQLDLSDTRISDAGLVELSEMTTLKQLNLSETAITDAGLVNLGGSTHLR